MSNLGFAQMVRSIDQLHEEYNTNNDFPILQTRGAHRCPLGVRTASQSVRDGSGEETLFPSLHLVEASFLEHSRPKLATVHNYQNPGKMKAPGTLLKRILKLFCWWQENVHLTWVPCHSVGHASGVSLHIQ